MQVILVFHICYIWAQVAAEQPTALLNTGHRIPLLGLGTFKADEKTTNEAVAAALKAGYRSVWTLLVPLTRFCCPYVGLTAVVTGLPSSCARLLRIALYFLLRMMIAVVNDFRG